MKCRWERPELPAPDETGSLTASPSRDSRARIRMPVSRAAVIALALLIVGCRGGPRLSTGAHAFDGTGSAVAIDGDWAFVGSYRSDTISANSGRVLVYRRKSAKSWALHQVLVASAPSPSADPAFGWSVDVRGDRAIVGSYGDATTISAITGAAFIYELEDGLWVEKAKVAGDSVEGGFAGSVAIDGDYAIVGAPIAPPPTFTGAGRAFVYHRSAAGAWQRDTALRASDELDFIEFGAGVAIDGSIAVVGAEKGLKGAVVGGAVYVFRRTGTTWSQLTKLTALDAAYHDRLGNSVSVSGDFIVAGAKGDDEGGIDAGAAYVFHRDPGTDAWAAWEKLMSEDAQPGDEFGRAVSIDSLRIVVGAWRADVDTVNMAGRAFLFAGGGTSSFSPVRDFHAPTPAYGDAYGFAVSVSGGCALVGAVNDDIGSKQDAGSAFVYCGLDAIPPFEVEIDIICCWQPPIPQWEVATVRIVNRGKVTAMGSRKIERVWTDGSVELVDGGLGLSIAPGDSVVQQVPVPRGVANTPSSTLRLWWDQAGTSRVTVAREQASRE